MPGQRPQSPNRKDTMESRPASWLTGLGAIFGVLVVAMAFTATTDTRALCWLAIIGGLLGAAARLSWYRRSGRAPGWRTVVGGATMGGTALALVIAIVAGGSIDGAVEDITRVVIYSAMFGLTLGSLLPARVLDYFAPADQRRFGQRECPRCAETILVRAQVCKHCGADVSAPQLPASVA